MVSVLKYLTGKQTKEKNEIFELEVSTGYVCCAREEKWERRQRIGQRESRGNRSRSQIRVTESLWLSRHDCTWKVHCLGGSQTWFHIPEYLWFSPKQFFELSVLYSLISPVNFLNDLGASFTLSLRSLGEFQKISHYEDISETERLLERPIPIIKPGSSHYTDTRSYRIQGPGMKVRNSVCSMHYGRLWG